MSGLVSPAVRAALPVARKALESKDAALGIPDAIVFQLDEEGLLAAPEIVPDVAAVKAYELSPGAYLRMRTALEAMHAARRLHGDGFAPLVRALEMAGLLQSPESAEETALLRTRLSELRQERSDREDDLAGALGYGTGTEWADLISVAAATTAQLYRAGGESR